MDELETLKRDPKLSRLIDLIRDKYTTIQILIELGDRGDLIIDLEDEDDSPRFYLPEE